MEREDERDSVREMEQIQKGLEDFLEQELEDERLRKQLRAGELRGTAPKRETNGDGQRLFDRKEEADGEDSRFWSRKEEETKDVLQLFDLKEDVDEDGPQLFNLKEETDEDGPRLFDLKEDADEYWGRRYEKEAAGDLRKRQEGKAEYEELPYEEAGEEKEIDSIAARRKEKQARKNSSARRSRQYEDYTEDWDSRESREANRRSRSESGDTERRRADKDSRSEKSGRPERGDTERRRAGRDRQKDSNRKRRKSGFRRFLFRVAVIIILLGIGWYLLVGLVYSRMHYSRIDSVASAPFREKGVTNILLIGNDSRENGEDGRSDAMILLSISDKTKKIYMTSLLRDMYVQIPGYKDNRLNAAYSFGGAELLMETVEQNFDIKVNRCVTVNFEAFANLVDAVGGVDLELTQGEVELVNGYLWEYNILTQRPEGTDYFPDTNISGLIHLNGPQALAYTRNRYIGTDFGRTERQRKVLGEVMRKLPKAALTNPIELADSLLPNLTTNLSQTECFFLSFSAPKFLTYELVQTSIPIEGSYSNATIREMAVLQVDFEANKKFLRENVYGEVK